MKLFTKPFTNNKPTANRFLSRRYIKFSSTVLMITSILSGHAYSEDSPLKSVDLSTAISQTMNMHPELKVFANQADIYISRSYRGLSNEKIVNSHLSMSY
ncbi:MAG: cobalt-zinc-cadmium efflux system outer membrane protein [Alteromonadaceae bacterium]|jgi:cobalt-zinc-cadmium efflux system outer membrane protein